MRIEIFFAADKNIYIIKSRNIIPETIAAKIRISHRQFVMLDYPSENSRNEDTCTRQRTRVTYVLGVEIRTKGCMTNDRRFISILSDIQQTYLYFKEIVTVPAFYSVQDKLVN